MNSPHIPEYLNARMERLLVTGAELTATITDDRLLRTDLVAMVEAEICDLTPKEIGFIHHLLLLHFVRTQIPASVHAYLLASPARSIDMASPADLKDEPWIPLVPQYIEAAIRCDVDYVFHLWGAHTDLAWAPHLLSVWCSPARNRPPDGPLHRVHTPGDPTLN